MEHLARITTLLGAGFASRYTYREAKRAGLDMTQTQAILWAGNHALMVRDALDVAYRLDSRLIEFENDSVLRIGEQLCPTDIKRKGHVYRCNPTVYSVHDSSWRNEAIAWGICYPFCAMGKGLIASAEKDAAHDAVHAAIMKHLEQSS